MSLFKSLHKKLTYLNKEQLRLVFKAYFVAAKAHAGQKRDSGEKYVTHPLSVANILSDMRMDYESVVAALLHDVIEDTRLSKEFIIESFGRSVAELVDGVTKLTQIEFSNRAEAQAESFRKMVLAMARDIRVILIKLADRLHNMRTLSGVTPEKRSRITRETLDIYAPIANRLGMHELCVELESLVFAYLYPNRHRILKTAVEKVRGNRREIMEKIEREIVEQIADKYDLKNVKVISREKHLYSIYKKMLKRHISFTDIMDVYAFRIIVDTVDDCYRVLGIIHNLYKPIPGRFKDYIAIPKYNGYQSLHTTLLGPSSIPIEIQIRTQLMDHAANSGIAAHWLYKSENKVTDAAHIRAQQWVNNLLEMQKNSGNSLEFIENVKIDLFPDEVYVFTPKGQIMELPRGATAVDFAYAVHTQVGNSCIAARVDRQFAPLSTVLLSGQTVAINTDQDAKPNPGWLNFVVTSKARSSIRNFLKNQKCGEAVELGKQLLAKALADIKISFSQIPPQAIEQVLVFTKLKQLDDLYESVGLGNRLALFIAHQIASAIHGKEKINDATNPTLLIKDAEGMAIKFARCCCPIPGDNVTGIFNPGAGLEVHTEDCAEIAMLNKHPDKCVPVLWADDVKGEFRAAVSVEMVNQRGSLAKLTQAISDARSSIDDIGMSDCSSGYCLVSLKLMVHNVSHLEDVLHSVSSLPIVVGAVRKR